MTGHADWSAAGLAREGARFAAAAVAVAGLFLWERHLGVSISDEGYLWYGSWQASLGGIPGLDFEAYDPARYYWVAALSPVFGDTLLGVRAAVALAQVLGLWMALSFLSRERVPVWIQGAGLVLLCLWMLPIQKLFEHTISIAGVACLALVAASPRRGTFFGAGLCIGVAGVFGRNHALYLTLALFGITLLVANRHGRRVAAQLRHALPGVCVGYLPMLLLMLFVPGFLGAVVDSVLRLVEHGATNLSLPVPWPWSPVAAAEGGRWLGAAFVFVCVALPTLLAAGIALKRDTLVAACAVGIPYLHHAFARPDFSHLAQSICPLILAAALGAWVPQNPRVLWRAVAAAPLIVLIGLSLAVALSEHPGYQSLRSTSRFVEVEFRGEKLGVHSRLASRIEWVNQRLAAVPMGESVLVLPTESIFYVAFERKAPIWDLYATLAKTDAQQEEMIDAIELADVRWALVRNRAGRRNASTRFSATHPKVHAWIEGEFDLQGCWRDHCWYRRRAVPQD